MDPQSTEKEMAFEVPLHDRMLVRTAGKRPDTVLTVEQQIYTWRICEYTEPWSYNRFWCYESADHAVDALMIYLLFPDAEEPKGWTRAIDPSAGPNYKRIGYVENMEWKERVAEED